MHRLVTVGLLLATAHAYAAVTTTLIDLPLPGSPRILDVRPDDAIATLVTIPGGVGVFDIVGNAVPTSVTGRCGPISRNANAFAANRIAVVLVDRLNYDIPAIVAWLWNRDHLPVWVGGTSASTQAAIHGAVAVQPAVRSALLLTSAAGGSSEAHALTGPALVVYQVDDPISNADAPALYAALANASARELVGLSGGSDGDCGGAHLLVGLDIPYVSIVTTFITNHNPAVGPVSPSAVEYFNAGFGHYFMTADDDEIAGLDAGAYNFAFVRTSRTFKVLDAPAVGTVPVCRFFTTPGTFGVKSSHFYTADPAECEYVKLNPAWIYEKIAFHIAVPVVGVCAAGTTAVYRMYNNGQTGAPNHRFTTDLALYQQFTTSQNWSAEGIAFCTPS